MTFKELNSLYDKKKILDRYRERLTDRRERLIEIESRIGITGGSDYSGMPKSHSVNSAVENLIISKISLEAEISDLESRIRVEEVEYKELERRIDDLIRTCEDTHIRLLLQYRFIDLMSWQKVAFAAGGNNTDDACRKAVNRYIKKRQENL
ncbi:MAG: hypothetical protein ACI4RU_04000 [Acutalibacteraceae bacterium]